MPAGLQQSHNDEGKRVRIRARAGVLILLLGIVALFVWITRSTPPKTTEQKVSDTKATSDPVRYRPIQRNFSPVTEAASSPETNKYPSLIPQPMRLQKKVLVSKKWNDGPDAFGLDKPPGGGEGATVGPAAVTFFQGNIYVLDEANRRILGYDQSGNQISSVALPNNVATDLTVDVSGTALILVDHMHDSIYKVDGSELKLVGKYPLKETYPLGTKFRYDLSANILSTQEVHQDGLADIDGSNLIVNINSSQKLAIPFNKPVACVEEVLSDANGIIWVLYTLDGDFQMRRIARIDHAQNTVGTAEIDVYFAFDSTRHMVPTGNGVVVFGGDNQEGRLIAFDYGGAGF